MGKVQNAISQVKQNRKSGIVPTSVGDSIATITNSKYLWNTFCMELRRNNFVTNMAINEHIFIFLAKNKDLIEKEHTILKPNEKERPKIGLFTNTSSNSSSSCIGKIKNSLRSFTDLLNVIQHTKNIILKIICAQGIKSGFEGKSNNTFVTSLSWTKRIYLRNIVSESIEN